MLPSERSTRVSEDRSTSKMSCQWLFLTLLYAASFVQNSDSSDPVSLKCNETLKVEAGEMATLNCTITYSDIEKPQDCKCLSYSWNNSDSIPCSHGLMQYNGWDSVTYVSLTISNVTKKGTYTASIKTDCGLGKSSPIEVQVIQLGNGERTEHFNSTHDGEAKSIHVPAIFYGIFVIFIVWGMLYILFRTNRGREIMKRFKKKQTQKARAVLD